MSDDTLLVVKDLHTTFDTPRGPLAAVGGVSFELGQNETLGIVGESGSGKTVLSRTIMGLQPRKNVEVTGSVLLNGVRIGEGSIIAAGTLVPEGTVVPAGSLFMGHPGKFRRALTPEDQASIEAYAARYVEYSETYKAEAGKA